MWEYGSSGTPAETPQHSTLLEHELATRVRTGTPPECTLCGTALGGALRAWWSMNRSNKQKAKEEVVVEQEEDMHACSLYKSGPVDPSYVFWRCATQ